MQESQQANELARNAFHTWQLGLKENIYTSDADLVHTVEYYFPNNDKLNAELTNFGRIVPTLLEPLVNENNLAINLPRLELYNSIGERTDKIIHHPTYVQAGDLIYGTQLLAKMANSGGLLECLSFLFLSSQVGEAGHNCPIACSAGIIRVLQKISNFPEKAFYLQKLTVAEFQTNFTGAQFLTEIQGGSDVGLNAVYANKDDANGWRVYGEKWFCSNAGADLIFCTARYDASLTGTKGLALFMIPKIWEGKKNQYTMRRLKTKIGTCSMATAEIDFNGAHALLVGSLQEGFHLIMDNVLHISRLFNVFCVLGMARRAYKIAHEYAKCRVAFSQPIIQFPLIKETLARIKSENLSMLAAIFAITRMQDKCDLAQQENRTASLLLRLLVNLQKYLSARWSVEHIHHSLDILAGNGTIETFSSIPRLLRDCIVCENWEGTHNVLRMQILKDIHKYNIDKIFLEHMQNKLDELNKSEQRVQTLINSLKKFTQTMTDFHLLDNESQALQIQFIVDEMAILFSALMLLIEAMHQHEISKSAIKLDCYDYFCMLHLVDNKPIYNKNYIALCSRIIS